MARFRSLVTDGRLVLLSHRRKYTETITRHALTLKEVDEVLLGLTIEDYFAGPEPDIGRVGEVWKFAPFIHTVLGRVQLYVEVKIRPDTAEALCISFHEAEHPITRFPYRKC